MLGTNLATRPFYNERAVRLLLGIALLLLLALTVWSVLRGVALRDEERALGARAAQALAEAERLRDEAARMTAQLDPGELNLVATRAGEVNTVIEQRVFSWGTLLNEVEATLPDDVRVTALQPTVEDEGVQVILAVEARSPAALGRFMDALEERGTFDRVLPSDQTINEDETLDAVIEALYHPRAAAPSSPPGERAGHSVDGDDGGSGR